MVRVAVFFQRIEKTIKVAPLALCGVALALTNPARAAEFAATGPAKETKLDPAKFLGAVKVTFDLQPTAMSFDLPRHFCSVAEIEDQTTARIVVRVRYALNNSDYDIAHNGLKTGSPYDKGRGDWGEEWFTIYPDGTYLRHMKIHRGRAAMSQPTGFFREPPQVDPKPQGDILKLPWSWIPAPELQMPGVAKSPNGSTGQYRSFTYDQTQRAYLVPRKGAGPKAINFHLTSIYDDDYLHGTMWLVNPAIVAKNWNLPEMGISLKLDDATLVNGTDYRFGFEQTKAGRDLVIWLNRTINLPAAEEHRIAVSIIPVPQPTDAELLKI